MFRDINTWPGDQCLKACLGRLSTEIALSHFCFMFQFVERCHSVIPLELKK